MDFLRLEIVSTGCWSLAQVAEGLWKTQGKPKWRR